MVMYWDIMVGFLTKTALADFTVLPENGLDNSEKTWTCLLKIPSCYVNIAIEHGHL